MAILLQNKNKRNQRKPILILIIYFGGLLTSISMSSLKAEDIFFVTFISNKEDVVYASNHIPVKVSDAINIKTKLLFKKGAKLSCISPSRGSFQYDGNGVVPKGKQSLVASLSEILIPGPKLGSFKTRALEFNGYDPADYFQCKATNDRILLITSQAIPLVPHFKQNVGDFLFIQFTDQGKTITRRIPESGDGLLFSRTLFQTSDSEIAKEPYLLCVQRKSSDGRSEKVAAFHPVFEEKETIFQQTEVIRAHADTKSEQNINNLILNHIYHNYGKIGIELIDGFVK